MLIEISGIVDRLTAAAEDKLSGGHKLIQFGLNGHLFARVVIAESPREHLSIQNRKYIRGFIGITWYHPQYIFYLMEYWDERGRI